MTLRELFDFNPRRLKRYDKILTRKRLLALVLLGCFFLFYLLPLFFRKFTFNYRLNKEDQTIQCIEKFLRAYRSEIESSDASIWISTADQLQTTIDSATSFVPTSSTHGQSIDEASHNTFLPLIGNGKFVLSPTAELEADRRFLIRGRRVLDLPVPFDPVVNIAEFGTHSKSVVVTRYRQGSIEKCTCSNYGGGVISIRETFTAHRLIPSLFTQDIRISNPTSAPLIVRFFRKGWQGKQDASVKVQPILVTTADHREYSMVVGQVTLGHSDNAALSSLTKHARNSNQQSSLAVAIAYSQIHDTIEIQPNQQGSLVMQTFLNYTSLYEHESQLQAVVPDLKVTLRETVKRVAQLSVTALQQYHESAWHSLWQSGFHISHSRAPLALNGHQINATLYYLTLQRTMPLGARFEPNHASALDSLSSELSSLSDVDSQHSEALLYRPDRCYNGHSTFHASRLWDRLDTLVNLNRVLSLWFLTLEKQSCDHLLQAGARGVLQAGVLSLAGLRFTPKHLEFHSHPSDLQRPFLAHRLFYGNDTSLNLSVVITEENKALILVALDRHSSQRDLFACDAGCLDAPVRLATSDTEFPVKLTEPLTALLYITGDREHVRELKHSIHVKEIGEAPAHEHQTIALHRYGHSLGGLPTFFWVTIVILIIVFHLFLGKIIYNEYFNTSHVPYERLGSHRNMGRYSM